MFGTSERRAARARAQDETVLAYQCEGTGRPLVLLAGQAKNHRWW